MSDVTKMLAAAMPDVSQMETWRRAADSLLSDPCNVQASRTAAFQLQNAFIAFQALISKLAAFKATGDVTSEALPDAAAGLPSDAEQCATWRALCEFLLSTDDPMDFLRCWNEGNFEACRREWPEAPEAVYPAAVAI